MNIKTLLNKDTIEKVTIKETEYKNLNDIVHCKCFVCEGEFETRAYNIKYRYKCPYCSKKERLAKNEDKRKNRMEKTINDFF